jgi:hypothetical protein
LSDSNFSIPNPQSAHHCGIAIAQKPRRGYSITEWDWRSRGAQLNRQASQMFGRHLV